MSLDAVGTTLSLIMLMYTALVLDSKAMLFVPAVLTALAGFCCYNNFRNYNVLEDSTAFKFLTTPLFLALLSGLMEVVYLQDLEHALLIFCLWCGVGIIKLSMSISSDLLLGKDFKGALWRVRGLRLLSILCFLLFSFYASVAEAFKGPDLYLPLFLITIVVFSYASSLIPKQIIEDKRHYKW